MQSRSVDEPPAASGSSVPGPAPRQGLSVVVPACNEAENVAPLFEEIAAALRGREFEVIYVDDGSTDGTDRALEALARRAPPVRVIQLARNFGQSAALAAGVAEAVGDVIVTIDGDRQNDPADVPRLLAKLDEGYDAVSGWRTERRASLAWRRFPSWVANGLVDRVMGTGVHDNGCGLKVYRRELFEQIRLYGEGHRIILAQAAQLGARIAEVPVRDRPRVYGRSKYGLSRTYKLLLDLLALRFLSSHAAKPMRVFGGVGFIFILAAVAIAFGLLIWRLVGGGFIITTPLLFLSGVLLIVGLLLVLQGLLAELIVRLHQDIGRTPPYRVRRRFGERVRQPRDDA